MSNVKSINGSVIQGEPNPRVVALLEQQLEAARRGEVSGVAIATLSPDGCAGALWAHQSEYFSLIGAVARLQYKLLDD